MGQIPATDILAFVSEAGLRGFAEEDLLRGFCERLRAAGILVSRSVLIIDTLHPVYEGHAFRWRSDERDFETVSQYGRVRDGGEAAEQWSRSPFNHLLVTGGSELRFRLADNLTTEFPVLDDLKGEGQTDYVAMIHRFGESALGEMDGVYSSWCTDVPRGFDADQLKFLREVLPVFALALKSVSLGRVAETLVTTYLGRDAGRRVLSGRIERGVAERIGAVLWFSDLRGFTRISEAAEPHLIIPFLNDYADAIISSVHEAGGDVLRLIGDGTLAIFTAEDPEAACRCALEAETLMRARVSVINGARTAAELPIAGVYLGLHVGEVFYGNIGSKDRLDFTVVGPAVNQVSRIAAMCSSVERELLVSGAFVEALATRERARFVSVGRFGLRGVQKAQELFTIE